MRTATNCCAPIGSEPLNTLYAVYLALVLIGLASYIAAVSRRSGYLTASSLFVYSQGIMAVGTYFQLDAKVGPDRVYGALVTFCTLAVMLVSAWLTLRSNVSVATLVRCRLDAPGFKEYALIAVSIFITIGYFVAIGHSAFIDGLANTFAGAHNDVTQLRIDSYSGSKYFFPGYVNQFKNVLLPALVTVVLTYRIRVRRFRLLTSAPLVLIALFGLVGTNQRGALILFLITLVVYLYLLNMGRFSTRVILPVVGAGVFMVLATIGLARGSDVHGDVGIGHRVAVVADQIGGRAFRDQQVAAVAGFRYIDPRPIQYGRQWLDAAIGLTPMSRGSDLDFKIFETQYGSMRGTSPPSIWGSVFHNFGWPGVLVFPGLIAAGLVWVTRQGLRSVERTPLEVIGIAGTFSCLGMWAAGDPTFLLNAGVAVYIALWWWGSARRSRGTHGKTAQKQEDESEAAGI